MSDFAIRVENLGKEYRIGGAQASYKTLRESLSGLAMGPVRALGSRAGRGEKRGGDQSFWALKDVSFEVKSGAVVGVIGRNGAGKSTLLKVLARITEPTEGSIRIRGRVGSLLEVGTGFHPELSGRENIFLNGAILGMSRSVIEKLFDEIVDFAEVEKFIDTPVKRYSSGMYLKLAFAVAAHLETDILIVDEVLAVGDLAFQKKCLGKMGEVARHGRTVFLVSHNMGSISALCTNAIYLSKGQIKTLGTADGVVREFLSEMLENRVQDLAQLRFPTMGDQMRFLSIDLVAGADAEHNSAMFNGAARSTSTPGSTSNLLFGQPMTYRLVLESDISASGLTIGSSVFNSSGVCVGTMFGRDNFSVAAGEERTIELTISGVDLAPGRYYGAFSVGRGGNDVVRHDYDVVIGCPAFEVSAVAAEQGPIAHWRSEWGAVVLRDNTLRVLA